MKEQQFGGSEFVMAGLVPAIHAFLNDQDVDARHEAGHDGGEITQTSL
jgi:hypothetical protein